MARLVSLALLMCVTLFANAAAEEDDLSGQTLIIVGGTSGLGAAVARRSGALGMHVIIAGRRADKGEQVATGFP